MHKLLNLPFVPAFAAMTDMGAGEFLIVNGEWLMSLFIDHSLLETSTQNDKLKATLTVTDLGTAQ